MAEKLGSYEGWQNKLFKKVLKSSKTLVDLTQSFF